MSTKVLSRKAAQTKGALLVFLRPKMAQDARLDLNPLLLGINNANYSEKKAGLGEALKTALKGKLAKDADLEDVTALLDALEEVEEEEGLDAETDPNSALPMGSTDDGEEDKGKKAHEFLSGKLSSEDMATYDSIMGPAKEPGEDEFPEKDKDKEKEGEDEDKDEEKVTKGAMDAAIKAASAAAAKDAEKATIARLNGVREAERIVKPYIGDLVIAKDSAEDVYKLALDHLGVDLTGVPPSAYRAVLKTQPVPGSKKTTSIAQDAQAVAGFTERYPNAARIGNLG